MKMKDKIRSKDDEIREKNQVIKGLKRKLSANNVKLCEKKSVVNNLTRKLYAERIQFNRERQQLEKEWEEERERNTKLIRKHRDVKRRDRKSRVRRLICSAFKPAAAAATGCAAVRGQPDGALL